MSKSLADRLRALADEVEQEQDKKYVHTFKNGMLCSLTHIHDKTDTPIELIWSGGENNWLTVAQAEALADALGIEIQGA